MGTPAECFSVFFGQRVFWQSLALKWQSQTMKPILFSVASRQYIIGIHSYLFLVVELKTLAKNSFHWQTRSYYSLPVENMDKIDETL